MSAFFVPVFFVLFISSSLYAENCSSPHLSKPERAVVKWVYDGDTLRLKDDRRIRIIGIDTPETKHHKQRAEAYGAKAKEALRELLKRHNYHVFLRYEKERYDRYQRTLAHVFLPDGTNISNWLLEEGYAKSLAYPPNILLADCYRNSERQAQSQALKIWRYKKNQAQDALSLRFKAKDYVRIEGKVARVLTSRKSTIIELESNSKRPIQLKIKKKYLTYFDKKKLKALRNKNIHVSGRLKNKRKKRTLTLKHPSQIEVIQRKRVTHKKVMPIIKWSSDK